MVATLIRHPEFWYLAENLLPNHFSDDTNRYFYQALRELAGRGVENVSAYNMIEALQAMEDTRRFAETLTADRIYDFIEATSEVSGETPEEYTLYVHNVMDAAFRRDVYRQLKDCQSLCIRGRSGIEQEIYQKIDSVMAEFASVSEIPQYKNVVDKYWEEIKARQNGVGAGVPFKFPALNEYATIERGELFIFGAEQKQGKSIMLLNCAVDLLRKGQKVLYIDSELNSRMFTARMISHLTGIEYKRITSGAYGEEENRLIEEQLAWLRQQSFTHIYIPMFDQHTIYTTVKRELHTRGLDVLIVDYFKSVGDGDAFSTYAELGRLVDLVKNKICGELNIAGIGAAQATPLGRLADSARIARNASTIAIITDKTPEEIDADGAECGNKKLRVAVNRNGMQMSQGEYIDLCFNGNLISYEQARQHIPQTPY